MVEVHAPFDPPYRTLLTLAERFGDDIIDCKFCCKILDISMVSKYRKREVVMMDDLTELPILGAKVYQRLHGSSRYLLLQKKSTDCYSASSEACQKKSLAFDGMQM